MNRLLARRLEQELELARNAAERTAVAQSLAETYAGLLQSATSSEERELLEARARAVLEKIDVKEGDPLRLALLRSSYGLASRDCELLRLRLETGGTEEDLAERLAAIARQLGGVRERLLRNESLLERRINRTRGIQAEILGSRSDEIGRRIAQATYLEAWSRAYLAWLTRQREQALESQRLFGRILATGEAFPSPSDISLDLRGNVIFAESILGIAFAKSFTDSPATVRAWLQLLEAGETAEAVREALPYWRIGLLSDAGAHGEALKELRGLPDDAPVVWLRLAAVCGLGSRVPGTAARMLGTEAVASLAARSELNQVVDLAERFGLEEMERDGFALYYVSGVCRYDDARIAKESGEPDRAVRAYRAALDDFDAALAEPDADEFISAVPGVVAMRAACSSELGDHERASKLFEEASRLHSGMKAGNFLWWAIVSLDKFETGGGERDGLDEHRAALIERFLSDHPSHPSAPKALLRRFATIENPTLQDAETLVMVPTATANGALAHQQGIRMLYRIFRRGSGAERITAGRRFIEVVPIPTFDPDAEPERQLVEVLQARQLLDIALSPGIDDPRTARAALAAIDRGVTAGIIDLMGKERELDYRRLSLALLEGASDDALYYFQLLEQGDQTGDDWLQVAARTLYNAAIPVLLDETIPTDDKRNQYGIDGVRRATEVLLGDRPENADYSDPANYKLGRSLALADRLGYESSGRIESLERSNAIYRALVAARGTDARALAGLAWTATELGDDEESLATLRTLVSSTAVGSDDWFRYKTLLVELLVRVDPVRAREVLDQHVVLHPGYGPKPWGPMLETLHGQVGPQEGAS